MGLVEFLEAEAAEKRAKFEPFAEAVATAMQAALDRGLKETEMTQALLEVGLTRIVETHGAYAVLEVLRLYIRIAEAGIAEAELGDAAPVGRA